MRQRHGGFTFIECATAVMTIAILGAICFPIFATARTKAEVESVLCEIGWEGLGKLSVSKPGPFGYADAGLELLRQAETRPEKDPLFIGEVALSGQKFVPDLNGQRWRITAKENGLGVADAMVHQRSESAGFRELLVGLYEHHGRNRKELWTKLGLQTERAPK